MADKVGKGHASAMFRLGVGELRQAMYTESNIAKNVEYGIYFTKTPGEVAEERRDDVKSPEEEGKSILQQSLQQAADKMQDKSKESDKGLDR